MNCNFLNCGSKFIKDFITDRDIAQGLNYNEGAFSSRITMCFRFVSAARWEIKTRWVRTEKEPTAGRRKFRYCPASGLTVEGDTCSEKIPFARVAAPEFGESTSYAILPPPPRPFDVRETQEGKPNRLIIYHFAAYRLNLQYSSVSLVDFPIAINDNLQLLTLALSALRNSQRKCRETFRKKINKCNNNNYETRKRHGIDW